tara:strand:- start:2570 stop:4477 length:1908 start_codon:yes stop_codon:yes gene_type:complete
MWGGVAFVFIWRWLCHLGRLSYPGRLVKVFFIVCSVAALYAYFGRQFNLEIASAFLIEASLLKLLEMRSRRDAYVVVFLGFFVLSVGFLFEQGIRAAIVGIFALWALVSALISLHFNPNTSDSHFIETSRAGRLGAMVLLSSLPVMLVFYMFFPRIAPLWTFNLHAKAPLTGLSETMSPGDISRLGQSAELAFRASFDNAELPSRGELYWRAMSLDTYDGRVWRQNPLRPDKLWAGNPALDKYRVGKPVGYEIIQEPTQERWLFSLKNSVPVERGTGLTVDGMIEYREAVFNRKRYRLESYPEDILEKDAISSRVSSLNLKLPLDSNPRSRQLAQEIRSSSASPELFIQSVLRYFTTEPFFYTLRPPVLGVNDIDQFLFDSRRGFCEHYAGAFVFMARVAGIPARVVTGYQGGEWNDEDKFLTVRQYDAHAWAEVWIQGRGWVRVDPTAAVAPQRIQSGLEIAVEDEGSFLQDSGFSAQKYKGINWINALRMEMDSLNYYWQRWVLSYDQDTQKSLLSRWFGFNDVSRMLKILAGTLVVFFLLAGLLLWLKTRSPRRSPFMRQWLAFTAKAQAQGFSMTGDETPAMLLDKIAAGKPALKARLKWLANEMNLALYRDDQEPDKKVIRELAKVRRQL